MATVTGSWHSPHLWMMSTFDIPSPCPEIIIPQLKSIVGQLQPLVKSILYHTPTSFSIYTWFSSLPPLLSVWLFIHPPQLSFYSFFLFSILPDTLFFFICTYWFSFYLCLSNAISSPCSSWLNQASSAADTTLVSFIYFSLTLYSLSPLRSLPNLSLCMSALSPFCQLISAVYSIKCFCIASVAAFLFYSAVSICFSSRLLFYPLSILSLWC